MRMFVKIQKLWHQFRLRMMSKDAAYLRYLKVQYERSIPKYDRVVSRVDVLVSLTSEYIENPQDKRVLCIGCRNEGEISAFEGKGFGDVVGIDIFSKSPKIKVMDMHNLQFDTDSFDVIYSSHSLEHAFDVEKVVQEILKVSKSGSTIAIEVPANYPTTEADRYDFGSTQGVLALFEQHIDEILYAKDLTKEETEFGTDIARVIFTVS